MVNLIGDFMSRNLLTCIAILSMLGGLVVYGFSDFVLWLNMQMLSDSADLIASLVVITIVLVGMWTCATADEKELEFFKEEQHKEEIRQRMLNKPMPPGIYEN